MQVSCDTSKLEQSLKKLHEEAVRKMQGMVQIFSYKVTFEAIENTPFGDDQAYAVLYNNRARLAVLPPEAGSAKGGWTISFNGPTRIIFPERATDENAQNIKNNADIASQGYKLGDDLYIMNSVRYVASDGWPYDTYKNGSPVRSLESGASTQAPFGIMEPTLHAIYGIYRSELKSYYEAS
jgi:hypothetical protein